jgi:carbon-monoxide dehydrogenase medium subunit
VLGATLVLGSLAGEREVTAEDFFKGLFETDLLPGELIVAVKFPATQPGIAIGFSELARRHGDFALVGLAAVATMERDRIEKARLVYFGCVDRAKVARAISSAVAGLTTPLSDTLAFEDALRQDLTPDDTPGLRADTKLHMATVLTRRVLNSLSEREAA